MKKTSKLLSAMLLLGQMVGYTPNVLADEEQTQLTTEQTTNVTNTETTDHSTETEETASSTTDEIQESVDSTTDSTQSSESEKEEIDTTDSSSEATLPEQQPSENESVEKPEQPEQSERPIEKPTTKPNDSVNQKPTQPVEVVPEQPKQPATPQVSAEKEQKSEEQAQPVQEEPKNYHQAPTAPIQEIVPSSKQDNEGNIHFEKDESVESFIRKIGESARKVGQENDLYASVMIAQAILESASGQSQLAQAPNYNLFGIKGTHNGKCVSFATQEDLGNGVLYTTQATFRQYENYEDSLNDYAKLLKEGLTGNSHFYDGVWKSNAKTYQEATKFLTGRYATDTSYDKKLNGLIETYDLTKYDKEVAGPQLSKEGYIVPVKNYTISSPFGTRGGEFHRGLDLAAPQGEPIYASKAGTVVKAEFHPSWGNVVAIEHEDGTTALYAHQQEYQVKVGDKVKQGQIIGYVGSTGNSTGSHLHFELCLDHSLSQSQLVDPETVLF
ncbi:peptidoglycan DD-metalloendopeptidase family protein [Enterococcus hirae]|uniref:peptidoglycan DD-metalloendopeptidase family protein n=1 Tax=Enterococcus hirae TaxID=1354 RepID=UPI001A95CFFA|nr:peptidoglycan DD-metalloendopeptidase family protein [Enterococcus hirae]MBO1134945.1 peptidoglycan DD-metalloendopeptidase family protein [Enterococcus hirae]